MDQRTTKRSLFFRKKIFKNFLVQRICFLPHLARINWYKTQCSKIEKSAITNINGRGCTIISNTVINLFWKLFLIYYLVGPIWGTPHLIFFCLLQKNIIYIYNLSGKKNSSVVFFPILEHRDFPRLVKRPSRPFSYARIGFPKVQFSFLSLTKFQTSSHIIWVFFCLFQI